MGIDYGLGRTNIDKVTGIRYGVIPIHDVMQAWYDSSEGDYGEATCPKCGNPASDPGSAPDGAPADWDEEYDGLHNWSCADYVCHNCKVCFGSDEAFGDEPIGGFNLDDGEYIAHQGHDDCDIFIIKSPYYTWAPFCSPCAPGAAYLRNGAAEGDAKGYCFGADWFDADISPCPYPVFRVDNDECVYTPPVDTSAGGIDNGH